MLFSTQLIEKHPKCNLWRPGFHWECSVRSRQYWNYQYYYLVFLSYIWSFNHRIFFNFLLKTQFKILHGIAERKNFSLSSSAWIEVTDWEISAGRCDVFIAISQLPVEILQSGIFMHSNYKLFTSSASAPLLSWAEFHPNCLSSMELTASFLLNNFHESNFENKSIKPT